MFKLLPVWMKTLNAKLPTAKVASTMQISRDFLIQSKLKLTETNQRRCSFITQLMTFTRSENTGKPV